MSNPVLIITIEIKIYIARDTLKVILRSLANR